MELTTYWEEIQGLEKNDGQDNNASHKLKA